MSLQYYGIIYRLTNPDNEIYIGSTVNPSNTIEAVEKRFKEHVIAAKRNPNSTRKLLQSIIKDGPENFKKEILEVFPLNGVHDSTLREREKYYIDKYDSFYHGLNSSQSTGKSYLERRFIPEGKIAQVRFPDIIVGIFDSVSDAAVALWKQQYPDLEPTYTRIDNLRNNIRANMRENNITVHDVYGYYYYKAMPKEDDSGYTLSKISNQDEDNRVQGININREVFGGNYSLSLETEKEIVNKYRAGCINMQQLAEEYKVSDTCIRRILKAHHAPICPRGFHSVYVTDCRGYGEIKPSIIEAVKTIYERENLPTDEQNIKKAVANASAVVRGKLQSVVHGYKLFAIDPTSAMDLDPSYNKEATQFPLAKVIPNDNDLHPVRIVRYHHKLSNPVIKIDHVTGKITQFANKNAAFHECMETYSISKSRSYELINKALHDGTIHPLAQADYYYLDQEKTPENCPMMFLKRG